MSSWLGARRFSPSFSQARTEPDRASSRPPRPASPRSTHSTSHTHTQTTSGAMAFFSISSAVASAGAGAAIGVYVLPNTGERMNRSPAVCFRGVRGALSVMVPAGSKDVFAQPTVNVDRCLAVSKDALGLLGLAAPAEDIEGPAPASFLVCSGDEAKNVLRLLGLAAPEVDNEEILPAPADFVVCSGDEAKNVLRLLGLAAPAEDNEEILPAPADFVVFSDDEAKDSTAVRLIPLAVLDGTKYSSTLSLLDLAGGLLAVMEGSKSKAGIGLRPVARCSERLAGSPSMAITGGRGLLSVQAPKEVCWGLLPAASRHVLVGRCAASSNPPGEAVPFGEEFGLLLRMIPINLNCTALVGNQVLLDDIARSADAIMFVIAKVTPALVSMVGPDAKIELIPNQPEDMVDFLKNNGMWKLCGESASRDTFGKILS